MTAYFERERAKMVTLRVTPVKSRGESSSPVSREEVESSAEFWSWREELNLQPAVYKTAALPLSYASL